MLPIHQQEKLYSGRVIVLGMFVVSSAQALVLLLSGREGTSTPSLRACHPAVTVLAACLRLPCPWARHRREQRGSDLYRLSLQQYLPTRPSHSVPWLFPLPHSCSQEGKGTGEKGKVWFPGSTGGWQQSWDGAQRQQPPRREVSVLPHVCTFLRLAHLLKGQEPQLNITVVPRDA